MQQQIAGGGGMTIGPISELVAEGKLYREILRLADEERAELIVIGGHASGGLNAFGSTTKQVVRRATCPVLTVRARGTGRLLCVSAK